jgi:NADH dehydrogenase
MKIAVIFGGSGFLGQSVIQKLLKQNFRIKVITQDKEKSAFLKTFAAPDFLTLIQWDYKNFEQLDGILKNAYFVINLVGILAEEKKGDFNKSHSELSDEISKRCHNLNTKNLVYVSALGANRTSKSLYLKSKILAEEKVLQNFPQATILRPSIIFGEGDNFFNKFAKMARPLGILPLINNGKTKFQPIYVEDVAEIICKSYDNKKVQGKIYEIGGDKVYSFKSLLEMVGSYLNIEIKFVNLPFAAASLLACFLEIATKKILTTDQIEMLKTDNVLSENNFKTDFAINPKMVEEIVPNYIR